MSRLVAPFDRPTPAVSDDAILAAARFASEYFSGGASVHRALQRIGQRLAEEGIPAALIGALALAEHGHARSTIDVDLLMTRDGYERFRRRYLGQGYEARPGRRGLRDVEQDVPIDILLAGEFPGDGLPKSVCFPDPENFEAHASGIARLPLPILIDLKLASGLSAPHRLKDLADVLELIRAAKLPRELVQELDPSVRAKYDELWQAAQTPDPF